MPPYSWVRSKVPRGSSSSSRSLASVANPVGELGDGFRPELARRAPADAVIDRGVEVRVKRHGMQRRIRHGTVVVVGQNRCGGQGSLRCDERPVVDLQHLPDVGEPGQRVGVPLLDVVHGVLVAQDAVVRQRIGHHGRIEGIVGESAPVTGAFICSGDGGSACSIESSQPSRSAGATLIQVTISAGGLSFHDG